MPKFNQYTIKSIEAALAGGKILLKYFEKYLDISYKAKYDPVTIADKASQKAIISIIKKSFPKHSFMAEEDRNLSCNPDNCWVIDPLDGTVNFIHDIPMFCISIAYKQGKMTLSGVIYCPVQKEIFVAEKGKGAFLNGKRIKVSSVKEMAKSLVVTGFPYDRARLKRVVRNLSGILGQTQGVRRLGSAAMDLAYVASGRLEAFWEEGLYPWDMAAGALIVKEAGGKVTDYAGGKDFEEKRHLIASNGLIHKKMLQFIKA